VSLCLGVLYTTEDIECETDGEHVRMQLFQTGALKPGAIDEYSSHGECTGGIAGLQVGAAGGRQFSPALSSVHS
jgi:hypothetical protein